MPVHPGASDAPGPRGAGNEKAAAEPQTCRSPERRQCAASLPCRGRAPIAFCGSSIRHACRFGASLSSPVLRPGDRSIPVRILDPRRPCIRYSPILRRLADAARVRATRGSASLRGALAWAFATWQDLAAAAPGRCGPVSFGIPPSCAASCRFPAPAGVGPPVAPFGRGRGASALPANRAARDPAHEVAQHHLGGIQRVHVGIPLTDTLVDRHAGEAECEGARGHDHHRDVLVR